MFLQDEGYSSRVGDDLLLPDAVEATEQIDLSSKGSTKLDPFSATIQAIFLSNLVIEHVLRHYENHDIRERDARCLE